MAKDIEQELDAIFARHHERVAQARTAAAGKSATEESVGQAAAHCLSEVITPALQHMAQALNGRGVAARVPGDAADPRIDIPVSRHARIGHGFGGYPYLRARFDRHTRRIHFERNVSDSHGSGPAGDYAVSEITPELVKSLVLDLVRAIYGPPL
jgi:hypothetical protein